jgi:hypothetical protein
MIDSPAYDLMQCACKAKMKRCQLVKGNCPACGKPVAVKVEETPEVRELRVSRFFVSETAKAIQQAKAVHREACQRYGAAYTAITGQPFEPSVLRMEGVEMVDTDFVIVEGFEEATCSS